jgi:energy-coupling factor transporter ATP-binding protein EcfA2
MIECKKLTYRYPNGFGIYNIDMTIPDAACYLLAGANGSGKTTLLKILAGGFAGYTGEVSIDEVPLRNLSERGSIHGAVALSPQQPEMQFSLPTVRDELRFTASVTGTSHDKNFEEAMLNGLGLQPFLDKSPFDLPPVERKLLSLAIAALIPTPFIALDEPTAGIDPLRKDAVLKFIRFIHTHKGVIIVSHDIDTFLPLSTHIGVMKRGKMVDSCERSVFLTKLTQQEYNPKDIQAFTVPRFGRILTGRAHASVETLVSALT